VKIDVEPSDVVCTNKKLTSPVIVAKDGKLYVILQDWASWGIESNRFMEAMLVSLAACYVCNIPYSPRSKFINMFNQVRLTNVYGGEFFRGAARPPAGIISSFI